MTGVRIRWAVLGKVAAIAVAGLAALQILPGMLRAPEPAPLAADVGLPRPNSVPRFQRHETRAKGTTDRGGKRRRAVVGRRRGPAATTVISSSPRRRPNAAPAANTPRAGPAPGVAGHSDPAPPSPPAAPAEAELAPPAEPVPAPPIEPPPPPNDGSAEFAPH